MTKDETASFIRAYLDGDTAIGNIIPIRDVLESAITYLKEQPVEGLEAEVRRWIHAQRNNGRKVFGWIDMVELAARHFYELGLKSKK